MRRTQSTAPAKQDNAQALHGMPFEGGYLTDGETLFRIERTLVEDPRGDLLVELEDCGTLELIVCSASLVGELGLRPVQSLSPA